MTWMLALSQGMRFPLCQMFWVDSMGIVFSCTKVDYNGVDVGASMNVMNVYAWENEE